MKNISQNICTKKTNPASLHVTGREAAEAALVGGVVEGTVERDGEGGGRDGGVLRETRCF